MFPDGRWALDSREGGQGSRKRFQCRSRKHRSFSKSQHHVLEMANSSPDAHAPAWASRCVDLEPQDVSHHIRSFVPPGNPSCSQHIFSSFDGKSFPAPYESPKFTGPEPVGEVEGGKLYTGSCHCGAATIALKSKPIDKDLKGLVECNCSSCGRVSLMA